MPGRTTTITVRVGGLPPSPGRPTEVDPATATTVSDVTTPHIVEPIPEDGRRVSMKRVNVTVTVLSVAGLFVKETASAKKRGSLIVKKFPSRGSSPSRRLAGESSSSKVPSKIKTVDGKDGDNSTLTGSTSKDTSAEDKSSEGPATTVVASFSRVVNTSEGRARTVMTHVPSLPLPLSSTNTNGSTPNKTLNSVVHWPEQPRDTTGIKNGTNANSGEGRVLSSYQFQRTFQREERTHQGTSNESSSERFAPQPLQIQVAISRSGRMFKLGTARVLLSGEEDGESSINVPIVNCNPAVPKNSKLSKVLSSSGGKEKMIPMMKLKGDTLKCGLDPNATLRVLVHVSEPIGETLEISKNMTVTMIAESAQMRQRKEEERRQKQSYERQNALAEVKSKDSTDNIGVEAYPKEICWEYNRALAAVVAKDPTEEGAPVTDEEEGPLLRVLTTLDEEENDDKDEDVYKDEPSCTSSAYMSAFDDSHPQQRYPTKGRSELTGAYSASTMTTEASDLSTVISDLTDGRSWLTHGRSELSQTGIEVIPFAPSSITLDTVHLPANSRLRLKEGGESMAKNNSIATRASLVDTKREGKQEHSATPFPQASSKKKGWQQRLTCGMPICGVTYNEAVDHLSAVNEEDDAVVTDRRWGLANGCDAMETNESYYTEDDGTSVEDDSTDNCSESTLCEN